ncbi:MAG TPA: YbjQ family protein [Rubellimicrobium sp.]|jgi:uncharacterized protein YbjQ (UPF0145 family)|nr:YbjQ family protein [Rubellimicrobium sp.]
MFRQPAPRKEPVLRSVDSGPRSGEAILRREEPVLRDVLVTTTPTVEGRPVATYLGVVAGQSLLEAGLLREPPKGLRRLFGKRSTSEQDNLSEARDEALRDLKSRASAKGADAVLGLRLDHQVLGGTLVVVASGTAVRLG